MNGWEWKMKTERLVEYMELRSQVEETEWGLDTDYFEPYFINGVRHFFGVQLDNDGNILSDTQQPFKGFIDKYRIVGGWLRDDHTPSDDEWDELNCECGNH